jgi:(1->4)-alpha-D-glucan 1-alpha-D-glucosylmutase
MTALEQLAQANGIALSYHDIWSTERRAPPDVLRSLLQAMHVDVRDDAAIEHALARQRSARWHRVLAAASLASVDQATVVLRLPAALQRAALAWRLVEDDGHTHKGVLHAADCPEIERERIGDDEHVAVRWTVPLKLPVGYHQLQVQQGGHALGDGMLIVAPRTCHVARALHGRRRVWGVAIQLYAVRSARNWGIGDYTDLASVIDVWGRRGAAIVGVNPLHAMFPHNPAHTSPYSPSSRRFLNALYLDVEAVAEFAECEPARERVRDAGFQARLRELRAAPHVDYPGVAQTKWPVLEQLFTHFAQQHLAHGTPRARAFAAFCAEQGEALERHARFEALQEHFFGADAGVWGWPVWPEPYRDPDAPAVAQFADAHRARVQFFQYVQWLCDEQLGHAARRAQTLGIGIYNDLAVSADRAGADAWSSQHALALGASIGAPPDEFNAEGQNWGLPPPIPQALEQAAFAPFIQMLRACMRHAGALRIDHVMALTRLYWTTGQGSAAHGTFVHYPLDTLLAIVRLESRRQRCVVIGEALGTVPAGLREHLADSGVLSYRVLIFERDAHRGFPASDQLPPDALLAATTHDLPTLAGWWEGRDLAVRAQLGLPTGSANERLREREQLIDALARERLLPPGVEPQTAVRSALTPALSCALHSYLARTPSKIVLAQMEDVLLQRDQVNLPGTTDSYPNWCRKLALDVAQWRDDAGLAALAQAMVRERGAAARHAGAIIPRATYRVQLHGGFTFAMAAQFVPYLAELGVSHLYCSPFLRARAGSAHGYDIVDHESINPEIGTRADFDELVDVLHRHGMSMLIDVVPNHMGVHGADNAWWLDVLEDGPASPHAEFFDIDWHAADPSLRGRVLLPVLGDQYGLVLERRELQLAFEASSGSFQVHYFDHRLPIDPSGYGDLIRRALDALDADAAATARALAAAFERLPRRDDAERRTQRRSEKLALKAQLSRFATDAPQVARSIAGALAAINDEPDLATLDALLDAQAYRLAHWRVASDEINYRRFFDINELAALRMERDDVFEATHRLVLSLAASGAVDGLRIDHSDGLADPAAYFMRLQTRFAEMTGMAVAPGGPRPPRPLYVVTEKITAPHERLPIEWAVHGTTGYRFANVLNGLLVDADAKAKLDRVWRSFVRDEAEDFDRLAWRCRHIVMEGSLAGELTVLATALWRLAREDRRTRDFTLNSLRRALAEVVAAFPVYRTYVIDKPSAADRQAIDWAIGRARRRSLSADTSVFDFIRRVLLGSPPEHAAPGLAERYRTFARRLQQYTAPVAAKGIEDTALYRHHRLVSLNDVGGDPDVFGTTVSAFHGASRDRALHWPHTLLATSTHDTKRSEDVRARIDAISEMPAAWRLTVRRWSRMNRSHQRTVDDTPAPTRNDEYLFYQTLVGSLPAGPLGADALRAYAVRVEQAMLKAARESKASTSWINPNSDYEEALSAFVRTALEPRDSNLFLGDLHNTVGTLAWYGALNGLSLALLKGLSPGVPDYYQGHETIELSLVDPDNRRPIDIERRRQLLAQARSLEAMPQRAAVLREWLDHAPDGRAKFWVTCSVLRIRQTMERLYHHPTYVPLEVRGTHANHMVAFAVHDDERCVLAVAARLYASFGLPAGQAPLDAAWGNTEVSWPQAEARRRPAWLIDQISGRRHDGDGSSWPVATLLRDFPVAALSGPLTFIA